MLVERPEGDDEILSDRVTTAGAALLMGVLTRGLNITRHPLAITNPLQLLVCIFEIFIAGGSIRFARLVLIPVEALSMVLSYAFGHGGSLGTTEKHICDKVSCG